MGFTLEAVKKKPTISGLMDFPFNATLSPKQWAAFTTFVPVKMYVHLSLKKISNRAKKERARCIEAKLYTGEGFKVLQMWECVWWRLFKTTSNSKHHVRKKFSYRRSLTDYQLLGEVNNGKFFLIRFNATLKYLKD